MGHFLDILAWLIGVPSVAVLVLACINVGSPDARLADGGVKGVFIVYPIVATCLAWILR